MGIQKEGIAEMLRAARQLTRVPITVSCFGVALLAAVAAGGTTPAVFLAFASIVFLLIHGNGTNDIADYDIDKVNLKGASDRPLVNGGITKHQLWWLQGACGVLAIIAALPLGLYALVVTLLVVIYNYAYSFRPFRITDHTLLAPVTLAAAYTFQPFTLGFASAGTTAPYPWLLALAIYFGFLARLLLKDFRDVKGDAKFGKRTFLLRYGPTATCVASGASALLSLGFAGAAVGFSLGVFGVVLVSNVAVVWLLIRLATARTLPRQLQFIGLIAKLANASILALLGYFVCVTYFPADSVLMTVVPAAIGIILFTLIAKGGWRVVRA